MARKLSEIMMEMAEAILVGPLGERSSEAVHASLLFAHIAWNRSVSAPRAPADYQAMLQEIESSNPALWSELQSDDPESLVAALVHYKEAHFPRDRRRIVVCGTVPEGNVHVEWLDKAPR